MRTREEEYLRRMKALGYEPSLNGMDDEDIEWELSKMDEGGRRREAEWRQPVYRPVDPGLKARILRMFGQPYDESVIPKGQEFYLNGWDNGEDEEEWPALKPEPRVPAPPGSRTMKPDLHGITYDPETGQITPNENGGFEIKGSKVPGQSPFWKNVADIFSPSRGGTYRPLSYTAGGNDVNTGGRGANTAAANPNAGGYADGGAYGDMLFGVTGVTPQQPKQYVSADQLKAFGWQNVNDDMVKDLNNVLGKYDITTPARIRHFLAQCAKETNKGEAYTELDYGDKTYFDRMYEGRRGIGNIYPGDGKKFIGGGAIHITGRDEYQDFADYVGDQKVMEGGAEYVARKYPWVAAGRWWEKNRMNALVDSLRGEDHDADVDKITDVVNRWDKDEARQERKDRHREIRGIIKD
ncbi:hypothetical protein [Anaeroselena agilis]|uniref:Uncharacterized protein n=1 Tax=Anaeroselena agilis TaxID=3063788 RepID=A0ABU3NVB0_9FIRM|nr:hypothetical protein [Selenomonadales bacterium 4137-cl]